LRHGKGLNSIKKPRWKKSKLEAEVTKTGLCGFGLAVSIKPTSEDWLGNVVVQ
jgi:hypothetical protein